MQLHKHSQQLVLTGTDTATVLGGGCRVTVTTAASAAITDESTAGIGDFIGPQILSQHGYGVHCAHQADAFNNMSSPDSVALLAG